TLSRSSGLRPASDSRSATHSAAARSPTVVSASPVLVVSMRISSQHRSTTSSAGSTTGVPDEVASGPVTGALMRLFLPAGPDATEAGPPGTAGGGHRRVAARRVTAPAYQLNPAS